MAQIGTITPDRLISDTRIKPVTKKVTVASGQNLARGAVIGLITVGAITPAAVGGNTGNGAMGAVTAGTKTRPGVYRLRIVAAAANAGRFIVLDPDGMQIGEGNVAAAFASDHLNFTLADGATDFVVGDSFTFTVAAGSGQAVLVNSANTNGSGKPAGVMLEAVDASAAALDGISALTGQYNEDALVFGGSDTKETHRAALQDMGIFLHTHKGVNQ